MRQIAMDPPSYQPTQSLSQALSEPEIIARISSIKALDIDVISLKIGAIIVTRIGHLPRNLVKETLSSGPQSSCFLNTNTEFLDKMQTTGFCLAFVEQMREELARSFSLGDTFLKDGYLSSDVWNPACLANDLHLSDLPKDYKIHLKLSSSTEDELVFELEEQSENKIFSIETFKISECWNRI